MPRPVPVPTVGTAPEAPQPVPAPAPSATDNGNGAENGNGAKNGNGKKDDAPKYEFTVGDKSENIVPCTHGDAKVEEGKVEVTTEDNTLKAVLTGGAGANVFLGCQSSAMQSFQIIEEFDITCSDSKIKEVVLTLESSLAGFIRSKHKASACVKLASASITPAGWGSTPLAVCYPTLCVWGPEGYKYETPQDPAKGPQPMPLGHYILEANFVIEATAGGFLDAHSTAIFVPESETLDAWEREHDPFKGDDHEGYGFTLTLKAETPEGNTPVAKAKPKKKKKNSAATQTAGLPAQAQNR